MLLVVHRPLSTLVPSVGGKKVKVISVVKILLKKQSDAAGSAPATVNTCALILGKNESDLSCENFVYLRKMLLVVHRPPSTLVPSFGEKKVKVIIFWKEVCQNKKQSVVCLSPQHLFIESGKKS